MLPCLSAAFSHVCSVLLWLLSVPVDPQIIPIHSPQTSNKKITATILCFSMFFPYALDCAQKHSVKYVLVKRGFPPFALMDAYMWRVCGMNIWQHKQASVYQQYVWWFDGIRIRMFAILSLTLFETPGYSDIILWRPRKKSYPPPWHNWSCRRLVSFACIRFENIEM